MEHVLGFDTAPVARTHLRRAATSAAAPAAAAAVTYGPYTPLQLAQIYNFPAGDGTGQKIGIIELGGGYTLADLNAYFHLLGISGSPNITAVSVSGGSNNPSDPSGASDEVVLDIEIIAAIVPKAALRVYFAPNTDAGLYNAIACAISDRCNVISISWGGPESSWSPVSLQTFNTLLSSAAHKNPAISICVASGDNGADDGTSAPVCDFPASSSFSLACGGTRLSATSGGAVVAETVWNDQEGATGGGISKTFGRPDYQAGVAALHTSKKRGSPDVSGVADPETGYTIYIEGQQQVVGGTSCVAPLWSALIARINQALLLANHKTVGDPHAVLYASPASFKDITRGNNSGYSAAKGWDPCTGLGSPNGLAIQDLFFKAR